ncbi:FAH [Linum grandiflorum]
MNQNPKPTILAFLCRLPFQLINNHTAPLFSGEQMAGVETKNHSAAAAIAVVVAVVAAAASLLGAAEGQMHHVVGGDRGWELATDLASWLDGRTFRVGDRIWFAYSAAEGGVYELRTKEEYYTCDSTNPIKMYTDGLNSVHLTGEGVRYFVSSNTSSCKEGLKLHVEVLPQGISKENDQIATTVSSSSLGYVVAAGPTAPSGAAHIGGSLLLGVAGFVLWFVGISQSQIPQFSPLMASFIEVHPDSHFPIQNIPYGVFKHKPSCQPRPAVAIGDYVLDLSEIALAGLFDGPVLGSSDCFLQPNLNKFLSLGRPAWKEARATLQKLLSSDEPKLRDNASLREKALLPMSEVEMLLPVVIGDYSDFFSSKHHAKNCGTIFRGPQNPINLN